MGKVTGILVGIATAAAYLICAAFLAVILWFGLKIFVFDTFPVNTESMSPTIQSGDVIVVNKLIAGARVYKSLEFSDTSRLESFRVKGFRKIDRNDVVVFNYPNGKARDPLRFRINSVYVKRCAAIPGDTISIKDGVYVNSSINGAIGLPEAQQALAEVDLPKNVVKAWPFDGGIGWTILNLGPLYVPRSGDVIEMNKRNRAIYRKYIEYETGKKLEYKNNKVLLGGERIKSYKFEKNYYFFAGDNVADSRDSRYFGLVPEEFIVGVAPKVLYSRTKKGRILKKI